MKDLSNTKDRIKKSKHFINGKAFNSEQSIPTNNNERGNKKGLTPHINKNGVASFIKIFYEIFIKRDNIPIIPSIKSNLIAHFNDCCNNLKNPESSFVWLGHSSYMIFINGKSLLIDPIIIGSASPISFIAKPFIIENYFESSDFPPIDYLIITHNHYDHLSKKSIKALKHAIRNAIVPLGVGKYLKTWGIDENKIIEMDWEEKVSVDPNINIFCFETKHFSGRIGIDSNKTLWASFLIQTNDKKIYIGGDSGYGHHFKKIGESFGKIDLAFLENGQYNKAWHSIHMFPEQTLQACKDLNSKALMPVHNSRFKLSFHKWNESLQEIWNLYNEKEHDFTLLTPKIGEIVFPFNSHNKQETKIWWQI